MKLILHIFAKDTRHFWPEILVSLAVIAVFVWVCPIEWLSNDDLHSNMFRALAGLIVNLVPVTWWILITRVTHAERLVGDTQFWLTRPYDWKRLLGAKMLFLAVFLYVPIFIAQCLLLAEAGFHPLAYLPGLFYKLLLITVVLVLPVMAIAAVTSSFARTTLTLLAIYICLAGIFALAYLANSLDPSIPNQGHLLVAIALCLFAAAVVAQYATRKTRLVRLLLIATPVLSLCLGEVRSNQSLIDRAYPPPAAQAGAPVQLSYSPNLPGYGGRDTYPTTPKTRIWIRIPMAESGVSEENLVVVDSIRAEVKAPDGSQWDSAWQPAQMQSIFSRNNRSNATFLMPLAVYNKFRSMPLSVHLTLAITQAKVAEATSIPLPVGNFSIPDFGFCKPQIRWSVASTEITGISCFSALRPPTLTYIRTTWSESSCSDLQALPSPSKDASAWVGSLDRAPAELGISPIEHLPMWLSNGGYFNNKPRILCPGTPIDFVQYSVVRRTQASVGIENYRLPKVTIAGGQVTVEY
ncbi:MAG: hypothetical protein ABR912_10240 [Terracidiphilus sp.]|jgi:hypothetical protein